MNPRHQRAVSAGGISGRYQWLIHARAVWLRRCLLLAHASLPQAELATLSCPRDETPNAPNGTI